MSRVRTKMVIVKPPLLGPDRVADAALSPHEVGDVAPPATNHRGDVPALADQFPQHTADGVLGLRTPR